MHSFLNNLSWRFATKNFDPSKKVSAETLEKLMEAIRQTPTSFGLEPFHVIRITSPELREKIRAISWDQAQVTDASDLLVFCSRNDISERIDSMIEAMSGGNPEIKEKLAGYEGMMRGLVSSRTPEQLQTWGAKQSYIALGFAMAACAELQVDSCAMEGFDPEALHKLLELPAHIYPTLLLPIGYRLEEPTHPKFRFAKEDLFSEK